MGLHVNATKYINNLKKPKKVWTREYDLHVSARMKIGSKKRTCSC